MKLAGVDTGGTFTDLVLVDDQGRLEIYKLPSTPDNPARAVLEGLKALAGPEAGPDSGIQVVHGTTVATNAVLQRSGARTALITTAGFEDVLEIGRQNRPDLYDLAGRRPTPLIPKELRFGLSERVLYDGRVEKAADPAEVEALVRRAVDAGAETLAVCLLHSYANPDHEALTAEAARGAGLPVSASYQVLREFREYERTSTTAVNAFVAPLMARYLDRLAERVGSGKLRIMQSNGGSISVEAARAIPVRTLLSGPAGGAAGAAAVAEEAGLKRIISFDMGGTSTDVSLYDGRSEMTTETVIGGCPVKVPMIRIHTVGAGGGSIAAMDPAGALVVGPQSAGADPGPVCYGRGQDITVTDANLALGRLDPAHFLGGRMKIDPDRVGPRLEELAREAGLAPLETAAGVLRVVNASMEKALRVISVERGFDPRDFTLVAFGGAGGLHACDLARSLGLPRVLIPSRPGVLSALGMVLSDVILDDALTVMIPGPEERRAELERLFAPLIQNGREAMRAEGFSLEEIHTQLFVDMRYQGQSFEITVPFGSGLDDLFHRAHEKLYGTQSPGRPTEAVNLRVRLSGGRPKPKAAPAAPGGGRVDDALLGRRPVWSDGDFTQAQVYARDRLGPGARFSGPALVVEMSASTYVPPDFYLEVDGRLNLILTPRR